MPALDYQSAPPRTSGLHALARVLAKRPVLVDALIGGAVLPLMLIGVGIMFPWRWPSPGFRVLAAPLVLMVAWSRGSVARAPDVWQAVVLLGGVAYVVALGMGLFALLGCLRRFYTPWRLTVAFGLLATAAYPVLGAYEHELATRVRFPSQDAVSELEGLVAYWQRIVMVLVVSGAIFLIISVTMSARRLFPTRHTTRVQPKSPPLP